MVAPAKFVPVTRAKNPAEDRSGLFDEKFLKTTIAKYDAAANHGPKISYEDVDVSLVKPVLRDYGAKRAEKSA